MQSLSDNTVFDKLSEITCCCLHRHKFTYKRNSHLTLRSALRNLTSQKPAESVLELCLLTDSFKMRKHAGNLSDGICKLSTISMRVTSCS